MIHKRFDHSIVQLQRKLPRGRVIVLGITGGIACGKSLVSRCFEELGAVVLSADALAREVVNPGEIAFKQIRAHFGEDVITAEGTIDRARLAQKIFQAPGERQILNQMTHPAIAQLADRRICELRNRPEIPVIIYEAPLLFEAKREASVDLVLVVTSTVERQIERLMQRDNLTPAEALQRISAQMPIAEKAARADIVIENNGSLEEIRELVQHLYRKLTVLRKKNPPETGDLHNV
jgi:dephospho-CoA kinase